MALSAPLYSQGQQLATRLHVILSAIVQCLHPCDKICHWNVVSGSSKFWRKCFPTSVTGIVYLYKLQHNWHCCSLEGYGVYVELTSHLQQNCFTLSWSRCWALRSKYFTQCWSGIFFSELPKPIREPGHLPSIVYTWPQESSFSSHWYAIPCGNNQHEHKPHVTPVLTAGSPLFCTMPMNPFKFWKSSLTFTNIHTYTYLVISGCISFRHNA